MFVSFFIKLYIDKGSAINDDINIVTIDISNPIDNPIKNNSLISPPPRLSFLNKKSHNTFIKYNNANDPRPLNILNKTPSTNEDLLIKQVATYEIIKSILPIINTSSGIM